MKKIKLMAEYGCYPLWDLTEPIPKNISTNTLSISEKLKIELSSWASLYEDTLNNEYPPDSGFKTLDDLNYFEETARELIRKLNIELEGKTLVIYEKTSSLR